MHIFKDEGLISPGVTWVCIHNGYLYIADTLEELVDVLNREWEADKHLVG